MQNMCPCHDVVILAARIFQVTRVHSAKMRSTHVRPIHVTIMEPALLIRRVTMAIYVDANQVNMLSSRQSPYHKTIVSSRYRDIFIVNLQYWWVGVMLKNMCCCPCILKNVIYFPSISRRL